MLATYRDFLIRQYCPEMPKGEGVKEDIRRGALVATYNLDTSEASPSSEPTLDTSARRLILHVDNRPLQRQKRA